MLVRKAKVGSLVRVIFVLLASTVLVWIVPYRELLQALAQVSLLDVLWLALISVALIGVSALKWRAFLRQMDISQSFIRLFSLYLVGYFVNTFSPSFIGGDVVRSLMVGERVERARSIAATFLERYTGILSMVFMAALACLFGVPVSSEIIFAVISAGIGCIVATLSVHYRWYIAMMRVCRLPVRFIKPLEAFQEGLRLGMKDRRLFVKALLLSLLFHLLTILNTAVVSMAVGWNDFSLGALAAVVPLILVVGAIPISPQGLGIQEGAFVYFLSQIGASPAQALAVGLVLRAKAILLACLGGFVCLQSPSLYSIKGKRC